MPSTRRSHWDPGTFTVPVTVLVTPQVAAPVPVGTTSPPPTPVAGGFTVGSTAVQLTVTDGSGAKVTSFQAPIVIHISASQADDVPAYFQAGAVGSPFRGSTLGSRSIDKEGGPTWRSGRPKGDAA